MTSRAFKGKTPAVPASCFVDRSAQVVGDVVLGEHSSVWFNCVLRADVNPIRVGARTNIQDLTLIHVVSHRFGTTLGNDVTVGHHAVLHGCTIGHRSLIGMGAIVMDGAEIGEDCIVAAGSLVPPGMRVPAGSLVLGHPAQVKRPLTDAEKQGLLESAQNYVKLADGYRAELNLE